jgi:hypothetical protein
MRPRQLVIEPEEAAIVRRVWRELADGSIDAVADVLNRDGLPPRGAAQRLVGRTWQLPSTPLAAFAAVRVVRGLALDRDVSRRESDDLGVGVR